MAVLSSTARDATEKDLSIFNKQQIESLKVSAGKSGGFVIVPDCTAAGGQGPWKEAQRDSDCGLKISLKLLEKHI